MKILIFKTDINSKEKMNILKPVFNKYPVITSWSVDTDDIDNVLRIVSPEKLGENDIILLMNTCGFYCEVLPD